MLLCSPQKPPAFQGRPVWNTVLLIVFRDLIQNPPVAQENPVRIKKRKARVVHMIGLGTAPIELQYGKILSLLQVLHGFTFDIISAIIKTCLMTDSIKYF